MLENIIAAPIGKDNRIVKSFSRVEGEETLIYKDGVLKARLTGKGRTFCPVDHTMVKGTKEEVDVEIATKQLVVPEKLLKI